MRFDPKARRRSLKSYLLKIDYEISIDEAAHQSATGSWGWGILSTAVECYLVGLFSDAYELIAKARAFLQEADRGDEQNKVGAGIVLRSLAQANWFLNRNTDMDSLRRGVEWKEIWFAEQAG